MDQRIVEALHHNRDYGVDDTDDHMPESYATSEADPDPHRFAD